MCAAFLYFVSTSLTPYQILKLYGIDHVELHGKVSMPSRERILKDFKASGPRVLFLSGVGMNGLNIAFANILIIVVKSVTIEVLIYANLYC